MKLKTKIFLIMFAVCCFSILALFAVMLRVSYKEQLTYQYDEILTRAHYFAQQTPHSLEQFPRSLYEEYKTPSWIESVLVDNQGHIVAPGFHNDLKNISDFFSQETLEKINGNGTSEGLLKDTQSQTTLAYSFIPNSPFFVVSYGSQSNIFRTKYVYLATLLSFVVSALGVAWILSELLSSYISRSITHLSHKISLYGSGNLNERTSLTSGDEFGFLSNQFNKMADQISIFIEKQGKAIRMEEELKVARRVQKYFFPELTKSTDLYQIAGLYEPASECGGDWWFYIERNESLYIFIGDVTGHGTASAMLTSSCRTALSVLFDDSAQLSPQQIVTKLNQSIYATVQGDLNMTMTVFQFDFIKELMHFCNASHEFPFFWKNENQQLAKKDLEVLGEVHGPRLGEAFHSDYRQTSIPLPYGTRWIFISDGIFDVASPSQGPLGERGFLKLLTRASQNLTTSEFRDQIDNEIKKHQSSHPLNDDISLIVLDIPIDSFSKPS